MDAEEVIEEFKWNDIFFPALLKLQAKNRPPIKLDNACKINLQELCLNVVISNFDTLCDIYTLPNITDEYLKLLLFLQAGYANELLFKLHKSSKLRPDHLLFLFNGSIKELRLDLLNYDWSELPGRVCDISSKLEELVVNPSMPFNYLHYMATHLVNIISLNLRRTCCNDEILLLLGSHSPHLKELNVDGCMISSDGIEGMVQNHVIFYGNRHNLEYINLTGTSVGRHAIMFLIKNVPSLKVIKCSRKVFRVLKQLCNENMVAGTAEKYGLTNLEIHISERKELNFMPHINDLCPDVTDLRLSGVPDVLPLSNCFSNIESLTIFGICYERIHVNIDAFLESSGHHLHTLDLGFFKVSPLVIAKSCPRLEELSLRYMRFEKADYNEFPVMNKLKRLSIAECEFYRDSTLKSVFLFLTFSPFLEELRMDRCLAFNSFVDKLILNCTNLKLISFNFCDTSPSLIEEILLRLPLLTKLFISKCRFIDSLVHNRILCLTYASGNVQIEWRMPTRLFDFV